MIITHPTEHVLTERKPTKTRHYQKYIKIDGTAVMLLYYIVHAFSTSFTATAFKSSDTVGWASGRASSL